MKNQLHTVLGANGSIGKAVVNELQNNGLKTRAVTRTKDFEGVECIKADALDYKQLLSAIDGSTHVYLCIGVKYSAKDWEKAWPQIMNNVIRACEITKAKLIFFDNIYMYGPSPLPVPFDEQTQQNPESKKGKVRKAIADELLNAHKSGRIQAMIGRSADIFGPNAIYSPFYFTFIERMLKGKAPQSVYKLGVKHTYSYTCDLAKALVMLALEDSFYGQVWHLPASKPITVKELLEIFNKEFGTNYNVSYLPSWIRKFLSIFISPLKEIGEMLYQFDNEYVISYEKFLQKLPNFKVTDYRTGIKEMIKSFQ